MIYARDAKETNMLIRALVVLAVVGGGVGCVGDSRPHKREAQSPSASGHRLEPHR